MNKSNKTAQALRNNHHIMVIDDESHIGLYFDVFLSSRGYIVTHHVDSQKALWEFRKHPWKFDLVLTDQNMPGISGCELAKRLLTIRGDIPIFLCSGNISDDLKQSTSQVGIAEYIGKPVNPQQLLRQMEKHLNCTQLQ